MMQTRIEQERVAVLITQEVYDAVDRVEQNWERIVATRRAEFAAERAYQGQLRLQQAGRQIVTDVLVALQSLGDSQAQAVQAVVDYQIAKVDLALAAGAMLGYGQVEWNPCSGPKSPLPDEANQEPSAADSAAPSSSDLQLAPMTLPDAPEHSAPWKRPRYRRHWNFPHHNEIFSVVESSDSFSFLTHGLVIFPRPDLRTGSKWDPPATASSPSSDNSPSSSAGNTR